MSSDPGDIAAIRRIGAFASLAEPDLQALVAAATREDLAPGDVLVDRGDAGDSACIVLSGDIQVFDSSRHGRAALATLQAPQFVGEIAALAGVPRSATIEAATPVTLLRVDRAALIALCRRNPDILLSVIGRLGGQITGVNHALGLYAGGFAALERDAFDPALLGELENPTEELRAFAEAFQRLARHIAQERRRRQEMASAALIQQAMLPAGLDRIDPRGRCDVFASMRPAREVGGDFYDVFPLDADRLVIAIGDVCGKGVPASLFMSVAVTVLRLTAREGRDVAATLRAADRLLHAQNASDLFATVFFGVLDLDTGVLDYANQGHNPPLLVRPGAAPSPLGGTGLPMGLFPELAPPAGRVVLAPGDALLAFTDGVTESVDVGGADYGDARLQSIVARAAGADARDLCMAVLEDVADFARASEPFDDITCLAVVFRGAAAR